MRPRLFIALAATAMAAASAAHAEPDAAAKPGALCASDAWRVQFPEPGLACHATTHGAVIAPAGEAAMLASVMDEAAARFERHFTTPQGAIALISGGGVSRDQLSYLAERGYKGFPWISGAQRAALIRPRVRDQLAKQRPELTGAALDAAVDAALAGSTKAGSGLERGALAHELNHHWFRLTFEGERAGAPDPAKPGVVRYGSSAPDWIDELAAVLGENEELTASRRAGLKRTLASGSEDGLYPLAEYLTMDHPAMTLAQRQQLLGEAQRGAQGGATVRVLTRSEMGETSKQPPLIRFYIQSRAFADFLLERTGDDRVFLSIAQALGRGDTFDQWLARDGAAYRLPPSVAALTPQWEAWLRAR